MTKTNAEKTSIKTKIHNAVKKSDKLNTLYESCDYTLKNSESALPIITLALKRLFRKKSAIFLLATPTHGNRGDQMIVSAIKKWCETYLSDYAFIEIDDRILDNWYQLSLLKFAVKKHDLIFLRGGGSVGDWYLYYEYFIRQVLKVFAKNKVVMFPQSVNFSLSANGEKEKVLTVAAYDSHPNFSLYTRDETSFLLAKEMFSNVKLRLCPDIALFLCNRYIPVLEARNAVLFCLRPDINETFYSENERKIIIDDTKSKYKIKFGDTGVGHRIPIDKREEEVQNLLHLFATSNAVVTDRYHGVIAAVITGTPVVALRSADHKIVSGIKWFEDFNSVFYAENIESVPALLDQAMQCLPQIVPDLSGHFDKLFEEVMNG